MNHYLLTLMSHPQKFSRIGAVYELKACSVTAHPSLRLIGGSSHPRGLINNRVGSSSAGPCANTGWLPLMDETKFDPRCLCAIGVDRKAGRNLDRSAPKQTGGGRPRPRHFWLFFPHFGCQAGALFGSGGET